MWRFGCFGGKILTIGNVETLHAKSLHTIEYAIMQNPAKTTSSLPFSIQALQEAGNLLAAEHGGLKADEGGLSNPESGLQSGLKADECGLSDSKSGLSSDRSGLSSTAQEILKLLDENPSLTYDEISARLGKARSGIAKHIKNLREKGFIK